MYVDLPELQFQLLQAQREQEEEQRYEQLVRARTAAIEQVRELAGIDSNILQSRRMFLMTGELPREPGVVTIYQR